jgi:L-ascorbate metabolism protein UlaG (beta-lactamase superfamily)
MTKTAVLERTQPLAALAREGLHHVGNSTHWIVLEGVSFLTDPWIMEPAERTLSHRVPPAPLPTRPDVVLITHRHEDHFDLVALDRLDRTATVVLPAELVERVRPLGFADVRGVHAGDRHEDVRGSAIDVVKGKHDVPEVVYRVERRGRAFFFGGDTMLTKEIEALAAAKPTGFVVLPGERSSLLGMAFVMTPPEAVGLAKKMGAARAVLSHHESMVTHLFPYGFMVRTPAVRPEEFPAWFKIPAPGDHVPFPWSPHRGAE